MGKNRKDVVRRHMYALVALTAFTIVYWLGFYLDLTQVTLLYAIVLTAAYWVLHLAMFYWVCRGHSRGYQDPGMSLVIMILAIVFNTVVLIFSAELRPMVMLGYLAILPFGMFRLGWKEYLGICLFTMSCYTSAILYLQQSIGQLWLTELEVLLGITFFFCLLAFSINGRELGILREAYRSKNHELRRAMSRIEELAVTDELTGLYNRRYLLQTLEKHQALSMREGLMFVLAFLDIDHFKKINDRYGHRIGDQVLTELSRQLKMSIREVDLAARYGGEEFVLLLSGLLLEDAEAVLERVRVKVMESQYSEAMISLTISIGVVQYHPGERTEQLIGRADDLLYEAKKQGRNRVEIEDIPSMIQQTLLEG